MKACIKLDLRKAYDTVNRDFVCYIMLVMGSSSHWVDRVRECITTASFSIRIEGQLVGFFTSNRGLRQRDPLLQYLFTLVMKYFSYLLDATVAWNRIQPLYKRIQPHVSHLIYADDLLVFITPSMNGLKVVAEIMNTFGVHSWLHLNRDKTRVYFNKLCLDKEIHAQVMGVGRAELPIKYLGIPLTVNYTREKDYRT